jgi:hypothetical protein
MIVSALPHLQIRHVLRDAIKNAAKAPQMLQDQVGGFVRHGIA